MISPQIRPATLTSLLGSRAAAQSEREAYLFLSDAGEETARLTWGELDRRARAIAVALRESLQSGDHALLLYPPGLEFVVAFFGCLQAGVVAVPAYPPRLHDRSQTRLRAIARDAGPRAALTTSAILAALTGSPLPELAAVRWIATEALAGSGAELPEPDPESVAFLQYTSGSTAAPKGVMVTHANLVHNEWMIGEAFSQDESSVVVGWLPLYHDMGLIGNVLQPLHSGSRCVLMSPVAFLQRPRRWLEAVSRYRATTSGGPNFAYELCVRRIPPEQREGLDLSSWRVAFNGAEPVRAETMERFAEAFAPCGFRAEAFYPCYGLAEATLFVAGGDAGRLPRVADRRVSCGRAWGGQRIAIVDPEAGIELPPGREGEIWVEGPSVARGYWRNPEATERDFKARLAGGEGPFLRTGDLGLLLGGELYVTGRIKDLIILRGRNHYPQDIELTAERSHPDLRPGGGAAFSVDVMGEERLVVVQEVERHRRSDLDELSEAVRRAVAEEHEVQVHEVVLVRAGTVPKTSSGKVQRRLCRELYLNGELQVMGRSVVAVDRTASGPGLTREALAALDPEERGAVVERWLRERAAAAMGVAAEEIDPERPLMAFGLDSLAAMELKCIAEAALGVTLPLADLLEGAGTARLAGLLLQAEPAEAPRAPSGEDHGRLSYGQKALWFLHRLAPEGGAYNIAVAARARGLDPGRLHGALTALAARHPALRTVFPSVGDEPVRKVLDRPEIDFATGEWTAEEAYRPFDLENGPLLRVRVFEREDDQLLLFAVHHIVADFASLAVLARELGQPALPDLPWTYADFVLRQEEELSGPRGGRLWERWRETLAGVPDLDLPTDRPRPPVQTWRGGAVTLELPLADELRALAADHGATLFMALLAAFQAQLGCYSGQRDFAVGSPAPGRGAPEWAGLVGYFVNPVALRANLEGDPGFGGLLDRARRVVLEGLEGAGFPFTLIAERLRPVRDPARSPLFQAMFLLQRARPGDPPGLATFALGEAGGKIDLGGVEVESVRLEERRAQFDLTLRVAEDNGLRASLEYNSDLFDPDTAARMLGHLRTLLAGAVADPGRPLSLLPLLDQAELRQVLAWGTAPKPPTGQDLLHRRFEEQAALSPDAEALVAGTERLTYAELNLRANRLARHLRRLGVGPEVRVGVLLERTAGLVVSLLAVLKAGGAYVPLDPAYPQERLDLMLEDSGAKVLIRAENLEIEGDGSDLDPVALPENLAYLIYTSGSTGRPKAVAIEHRSASAMVAWARRVFGPEELSGVLASTSVAFDLSVFELFVPLSWGGRVILAANALELPRLSKVTLVNTVPSALAELVRSGGIPSSVRTVNLAGEPVPPPLVEAVRAERIYNLYGPSEDTTYSTFTRLQPGRPVTIGRPIDGTRAYVLNAAMQPVPAGIPGELYLGGEGLARGYLGRPELTAERFLPDQDGDRLYRTGDLARWRNGELEFLGRIDHQVKVRGFRIELGEVEAALARQPGVRDAVVVARGEGESRRLVAYIVGEVAELRESLRRTLPEAMVPSAFVRMEALPLSPNGKVDRKALPDPEPVQTSPEVPRTPLQELLAGVLAGVLGLERVGPHDDFFNLGGHSLLATRVASRISRLLGVDLPVSALFQEPTVAGLAQRIAGAAASGPPLQRVARDGPLPLSFAQRRLWFLDRLEPGSAAYNLPGAVRLTGPLGVPALAQGLAGVVRRHEALRTVFPVVDGEPAQSVGSAEMELPLIDLSGIPGIEAERLAREEARTPFDLARGPVCRAKLLRLDEEEHLLLVTLHHIAADGWSLGIFLRELAALYEGEALPDLPVQYADYAVWQRSLPLEGQLAYWRERLAGLPVLELPADRPRPAVRDLRGAVRSLALPPALAAGVGRLARQQGTTLFMALLAAFQTLLARYTGEDAASVGSPVANRRNVEVEPLIGFFVNTLVLDARLGDDPPFRELLARVREACLGAYNHQDVPFELLVETLQPHRALSQNPLFQVMLVLEEPLPPVQAGDVSLLPRRVENGTAKFDLTLAVTPRADGGWLASAEHAVALFDPATVDRLLGHFRMLLEGSMADPGRRLSELPLLVAAEREQLLVQWNDTARPAPWASVIELFAAQAPGALAVSWPGGRLTYGELRSRAWRLAAELRALGVGPEVPVGLHTDRSPELVTGALAVLAAGGAYVPLDPSYPPERLAFMAAESGMPVLLTTAESHPEWLPEGVRPIPLHGLDAKEAPLLPARIEPETLAYVIYTSGSTGRPKGVQVPHSGLANLVRWSLRAHGMTGRDRFTLVASPAFDASVWEVWSCLAAGASLHIPDEETRLSPELFLGWLADEGITACFQPTPLAEQILERLELGAPAPPLLRTLMTGGDRLRRVPAGLPFATLNHYGPAENSIVSTWCAVEPGGELPAIGRPLDNVRAYVAGRHGELLPAAVPGELLLGGTGLARGYLGRPDLTAERFLPDPFGPAGGRLYRTGDLVRWLQDGQLDFLGRLDHQVKIRGMRVELGEVESVLAAHPGVREAAAMVKGERLVAWVVGSTPAEELKAFLRERLPEAMVPSAWVFLEALPLSPNGKVDRAALPAPDEADRAAAVPPRTLAEERLAAIWRQVMEVERLGVHDDFFELGGHSLLAVRAAFRISEAFGVEVPVSAVFANPTVASLALWLEGAAPPEPGMDLREEAGPFPLSLAQQRLWLIDRLEPGNLAYNQSMAVRLAGDLRTEALGWSLAEILRRHEPLRTVFQEVESGPVQVVLPPSSSLLSRIDLSLLPEPARGPALREAIREELALPFDLQRGPMARFFLAKLDTDEHVLAVTLHHIASDGWSMEVFFRDLVALYGKPSVLPPLPWRYVDFALWQRRALTPEVLAAQLTYWREQLADAPPLDLPTDRPRPARPTRSGAAVGLRLPPDLVETLRTFGRPRGITLFTALLTGFTALLSRYSGQSDVSVGILSAGRSRRETENLIGFFANTLVIRDRAEEDAGFLEAASRVRDLVLAAQRNQDVPFERLVEELQPVRDPNVTPLFQAMLTFVSVSREPLRVPGLEADLLDAEVVTAKFDLLLSLVDREGGVSGHLEYGTELFDAPTLQRMAAHLEALLRNAIQGGRILEVPLLSGGERHQLVSEWNDSGLALLALDIGCVHDLVGRQAARTPASIAVEHGDEALSYRELVERARRLAGVLRAAGAGPDVPVGLWVGRSLALPVGVLGVLEAGGACLPLDPSYPVDRLALMVADAGLRLVLAEEAMLAELPRGLDVLVVDGRGEVVSGPAWAPPAVSPMPDNLVYVLYTSGSTGRPKGVALPHRALVNLIGWTGEVRPDCGLRVLQFSPMSFDVSFEELFSTWASGGTLVLIPDETRRDPDALLTFLVERRIERLFQPFVALQQLAEVAKEEGRPALALRELVTAGEQLRITPAVADLFRNGGRLFNEYGPTETHVATAFELQGEPGGWPALPPIGRPIGNHRVRLLDRRLQPVPLGVPGELCIGGAGLARGYFRRPDLTAERFVPDPCEPGARLYRTGDLARLGPGGVLEYLGRIDHQVKLRGFRVELGEIETVLASHPRVQEAAVLVRGGEGSSSSDRLLVAYVTLRSAAEEEDLVPELRRFLGAELPAHMVPSAYVFLEALPQTPSGKVDRRALARIAPQRQEESAYLAPRNPVEQALADTWAAVLGEERTGGQVSVHDNFFDLGGHSLIASRLIARIRSELGVELPVRALFEAPTVAGLAERLEGMDGEKAETIPRQPRTPGEAQRFPVSFSQLREWILDRLEPGTPAYNVPSPKRIVGDLSIPAFALSLQEIVRRHESLRTTFEAGPEEPLQVVAPALEIPLPVINLQGLPERSREPELRRLLEEDLRTGFDLQTGPLLRVRLVRSAAEDHALFLTMHHIISDGWSSGVLSRELAALYEAFSQGHRAQLPELPIQYPDCAVWQRGRLQGERLEELVGYWRGQLAGAPPLLELPADRPRPAVRTARGGRLRFEWPASLVAPLRTAAAGQGGSLFMALLALFQTLLARLSGQDDVAVGTFSGNRGRVELEGLIGFFINTLALRTDLAGEPSLRELLERVREVTLGAYAHQEIPFEKLLESLAVPRDTSRTPIFQTMLVLQNFPKERIELSRMALEPLPFRTQRSNFDLTLWMMEDEDDGGIVCEAEYSADLFEEATVVRMMGYLKNLVEGAGADPDASLWTLPLMPPAERAQVLEGWSRTADEPAGEPLLHRLFEAQAARTPGSIAVQAGEARLTYGELNEKADRLARHLRRLGVGPESRVGLAVDRSPEMLVGMLGVLKAGGAYVPLDPAYPQDRLAYMIEDSGARVILDRERLAELDREEPGPEPPAVDPGNAAYVIYTSGSTGRPKGVVVSHRSIAAYTRTARHYYEIGPDDRMLQFGSISFDTSAEEIYPTLIAGATLVLRPDDMALSMSHFLEGLDRFGITVLAMQTAFWHEIVAGLVDGLELPRGLRLLAFGGEEALPDRLADWRRRVGPHVRLVNTYGPTEATIVSTYRELAQPEDDPEVPIGRAIPGARTYVLDRRLEPVPPGVNGELMIGGVGLARGYLGRPDLTAERFIPDPYSGVPGARLYRTGDLVRFRPDGDLLFRGRADRQLKVRGYRIEPGEIEAALRQHPALRDAVADVRGGGEDKRLVAWVVPREDQEAPPAAELRTFLRDRLPEPMVPSIVLAVAALPLTPSGKLDRRALPEPEGVRPDLPGYVEPATALESRIAGIFRDLLRVDRVGRNDNFFDLGGHSLLVVRAHQRLREALGREIPVVDFFRFPTVALLARHLGSGEEEKPAFKQVQGLAEQQKAAQLRRRQAMEKMRRK